MDLEPTIVDEPGAVPLEGGITSVEFRNVTFAYPSTTQPVLSRISFKVEAGDFLGVMGHTGAGKTTILKLLMRYYTPDEGEVLINGQPVSAFTWIPFVTPLASSHKSRSSSTAPWKTTSATT